jgi:hypothetical protein
LICFLQAINELKGLTLPTRAKLIHSVKGSSQRGRVVTISNTRKLHEASEIQPISLGQPIQDSWRRARNHSLLDLAYMGIVYA